MNAHSKAKLTALSRAEMIHRILHLGQSVATVAAGFGVANSTSKCNTLEVATGRALPIRHKSQATVVMGFASNRKCPNRWKSFIRNG